jgi:hypothetical protein
VLPVEPLEGRALLAPIYYPYGPMPTPSPTPSTPAGSNTHLSKATGVVTKSPRFYQFYTGPKLAELDAQKASGVLSADGSTFTFTGTNKGNITSAPALYVWGIDRSGNLGTGFFTGRPNVKFDAEVLVSLDASLTPTARVLDFASGTTTNLPAGSASIHGKTVTVTVPASLLPSTGLSPSQYRFNYWPEDGGPRGSSAVASFLPESSDAQVGKGH